MYHQYQGNFIQRKARAPECKQFPQGVGKGPQVSHGGPEINPVAYIEWLDSTDSGRSIACWTWKLVTKANNKYAGKYVLN